MKELGKEFDQLTSASQNLLWSFVDFSFYKFPPVYKENCKKLDTSDGNPMKTCLKLCSYNHPDNVDVSIHGEKPKMLYEEITKLVVF